MNTTTPRCPVCGTRISDKPTWCERCETPYHADCFAFAEGCAIYGCRKVPARVPPPPAVVRGGAPFGALLGAATTLFGWSILGPMGVRGSGEFVQLAALWCLCGAVLGGITGAKVRGPEDLGRALLLGLFGPAATALGLAALFYAAVASPFFLVCSAPAVLFSLPCALLMTRINGGMAPGRVTLSLGTLVGFALTAVAAAGYVASALP